MDTPASATVGIDTVLAGLRFPQPMYEPLRDLSQQLLLPGVDGLAADGVFGLKTNRPFVEAYLVGLNVEMGAELLWRGFPTDQRGTCFAQFWDTDGADTPRPDIDPISQWLDRALGAPQPDLAREQFVMLMRSALLRRYPNAIITSTRAILANGVRAPSADPADESTPAFRGTLDRPTSPSSASTSRPRRQPARTDRPAATSSFRNIRPSRASGSTSAPTRAAPAISASPPGRPPASSPGRA